MNNPSSNPNETQSDDSPPEGEMISQVRSLKELLDKASGRNFVKSNPLEEDSGLAEVLPFPFLGIVGQQEMKLALLLALINPAVGGVLLIGPRGTGKTTSVRSLADLLPETPRSLCYFGCMPEDIEQGGMDAVCPDCAKKYGQGEPLTKMDRVRLVELPLNSRLEDVLGGLDERLVLQNRLRLRRGILSMADRNLLYIDEVNLLKDEIVDAILDASTQGYYTVRRGAVSATYRSRFVLIGSMNPEEGHLRPQILDRFGLRVIVRGLNDPDERMEAYWRVQAYLENPHNTIRQFEESTAQANQEICAARELLPQVKLPEAVAQLGLSLIKQLQIDSLRAEITLFEAARAYAAADARTAVSSDDLKTVAPMALRLRRSVFMEKYFSNQDAEEQELNRLLTKPDTP